MIPDHIRESLELEYKLNSLKVEGDNSIRYYKENSDAKKARRKDLLELREEIVTSPLRTSYKERMLDRIQLYLDNLDNINGRNNNDDDPLSPWAIVGLMFGGWKVGHEIARDIEHYGQKLGSVVANQLNNYQNPQTHQNPGPYEPNLLEGFYQAILRSVKNQEEMSEILGKYFSKGESSGDI